MHTLLRGQTEALQLISVLGGDSSHPPDVSLTNSIYLIHENDTRLMISGIIEHLSDQSSTFTNVLVHY